METKKTLFSKKSETYMCCFNSHCPRHADCLRWEVGQYFNPQTYGARCISPVYEKATDGTCEFFRDRQPLQMPLGMTGFYYDMPAHTARYIKNSLIQKYGRTTYYEYHRGDRPITPAFRQDVETFCQEAGWTQPLKFDGETEDYVW